MWRGGAGREVLGGTAAEVRQGEAGQKHNRGVVECDGSTTGAWRGVAKRGVVQDEGVSGIFLRRRFT